MAGDVDEAAAARAATGFFTGAFGAMGGAFAVVFVGVTTLATTFFFGAAVAFAAAGDGFFVEVDEVGDFLVAIVSFLPQGGGVTFLPDKHYRPFADDNGVLGDRSRRGNPYGRPTQDRRHR